MTSLTIRVPDDLKQELLAFCQQRGISVSDLVRESVQRQLAVAQFRQLREHMLPAGEAAGYLTDDDVFNDIS